MITIQTACVYCSASRNLDEKYTKIAEETGRILAENNISLVYGGGRAGLMGAVAASTLKHGGKGIGVITEYIQAYEDRFDELNELHVVDTMHARKQMMVDRSDAFIILPGGYGTMDEAFEILKWKQLKLHKKPIIFVNVFGYWDFMRDLENQLLEEKFLKTSELGLFTLINSTDQIIPALLDQKAS